MNAATDEIIVAVLIENRAGQRKLALPNAVAGQAAVRVVGTIRMIYNAGRMGGGRGQRRRGDAAAIREKIIQAIRRVVINVPVNHVRRYFVDILIRKLGHSLPAGKAVVRLVWIAKHAIGERERREEKKQEKKHKMHPTEMNG